MTYEKHLWNVARYLFYNGERTFINIIDYFYISSQATSKNIGHQIIDEWTIATQ